MPEMKRIFIIGPMSDDTGLPLDNILHIKAALEAIFHGRGDIQIDIPQEKYAPTYRRPSFPRSISATSSLRISATAART
jgi:hypothetical protein